MEENEFMESSFGEIMDLIKHYEEAVKSKQQIFLDEELIGGFQELKKRLENVN